ncbi:ABC transporter [Chloropicon primus]|uniref:ABC transporter n=1 Tax=Chloropicon primus TaxID=1764295 RepID=A0A5B8MVV8_9CHLO|nr:ABC transporter [Chloropicon primus]|eukprot:QDZ23745.1 ABC transporter [Chloropicon primus]
MARTAALWTRKAASARVSRLGGGADASLASSSLSLPPTRRRRRHGVTLAWGRGEGGSQAWDSDDWGDPYENEVLSRGGDAEFSDRGKEDDVVIEFRDVWKSFGSKGVLRGASFKIKRGEAIGIIGPSGTGKSTALRLISGLVSPDSGDILVDGRSILEDRRKKGTGDGNGAEDVLGAATEGRAKTNIQLQLGLVFQNGALFDSLTVGENVGFRLYEHSSLSQGEIMERVSDSLAKVGLNGIEERYPSELSGGMKKRVALARAITNDGDGSGVRAEGEMVEELIMYDEPTAGLDPVASTVVEDLIRSLKDKGGVRTYIVVTHQASTIARAVDRIIFLHEGKVVWQGDQQDFKTTKEPIVDQFRSGSLSGPISYV